MEIWIDAQLSPAIALWITEYFPEITACSVRSLGLRDANDFTIFYQARAHNAVIMSKDSDFIKLQQIHGAPPQIIWITSGNTSNQQMRDLLAKHMKTILRLLESGEKIIEIQ